MRLRDYDAEQLKRMSLVELAKIILSEEQEPLKFKNLYERVCYFKQLSETEKDAKLSHFYTELNVDGNFVKKEGNIWGLKSWYRAKGNKPKEINKKKRVRGIVSKQTLDQIGDAELDQIDETIDEMEYSVLVDELDDEMVFDMSEEEVELKYTDS
ncbi:MAG TPA: DNA-directed RNA polymerase subunit delta [Bacillota bacterium]|nr:DNA-directed RNA polymerase subunit delta [Bacillota bacterium]